MRKQGRADVSGRYDQKVEPTSYAKNPGGVNNLGRAHGNHATDSKDGTFTPKITPMDAGRGFSAPGIRSTNRKGGSQGRY
jgi:hypothetical protein